MSTITLTPIADAFVQTNLSINTGAYTVLYAGALDPIGISYQTLIKFDVSSIPANSLISSAVLKLYVSAKDSTNPSIMGIFTNLTNFNELTVIDATKPATSPSPYTLSIPNSALNSYVSVDITTLVTSWITTPLANFGITIKDPNIVPVANTFVAFPSREAASFQPQLVVTYNNPSGESVTVDGATGIGISPPQLIGNSQRYSFFITATAGQIMSLSLQLSADGITYMDYVLPSFSSVIILPLLPGDHAFFPINSDLSSLPYAKYARVKITGSTGTAGTILFISE